MEMKIRFDTKAIAAWPLPVQDRDKLCPVSRPGQKQRLRSLGLHPLEFEIGENPQLSDRHRSVFSDGWVALSDVAKHAAELTPLKECVGYFSNPHGLLMSFRYLMCEGPAPRVTSMYVVKTESEARLVWDSDALPGYSGSLYVPLKWAHRALQYVERGVRGIFLDQSAPPLFYAQMHDGKYRALEPNKKGYGWNMVKGSPILLTPSQTGSLV